jgi:hypothetical protein
VDGAKIVAECARPRTRSVVVVVVVVAAAR